MAVTLEIKDGVLNKFRHPEGRRNILFSLSQTDMAGVTSISSHTFRGGTSLVSISLPGHFTNAQIKSLSLPKNCRINKRALMFPVQGTLDKTRIWSDKKYFQPSWDALRNAYCKILFTTIMANWRLNMTTWNYLARPFNDRCEITSGHLVLLPYNIWMHIFYYCGDVYLNPFTITALDLENAPFPPIPEDWNRRIRKESDGSNTAAINQLFPRVST